ncbi:MAG TPA: hypothetical protein VJB34_03135 [Bdellovibrionota bacterium]|nr:hypothetical protein [Bdellovibrionota bacterium]
MNAKKVVIILGSIIFVTFGALVSYTFFFQPKKNPLIAKSILRYRARIVLETLKNKDMNMLAQYVHPEKGVRFSPYAYVELQKENDMPANLVFTAEQIKNFFSIKEPSVWGIYDGSGEPMEFVPGEYYEAFVYDHDYMNAPQVGYNEIIGQGNTTNNSFEVYPEAIIVEYHFPGFDKQFDGMDWASLRLVFEKFKGTWWLVGVIHAGWTI